MAAAHDMVRLLPASGALKPMPEAQIVQAVQLLDLMLEHFADDGHWTRGRYDDGNGGHCLVGALLHLSRKHRLSRAPAIALLQDAMPRPGLPLVHFNDTCCSSVAELRSIILKARRLADDHTEQERADAAVKAWLLAQIEKKRARPDADIAKPAPDQPFAPERLAA
jgi:nicotinamidase-related amidase